MIDHADFWRRPAHEVAEAYGFGGSALLWWARHQAVRKVQREADEYRRAVKAAMKPKPQPKGKR